MHTVYVFETQLAYGLYLREGKSSLLSDLRLYYCVSKSKRNAYKTHNNSFSFLHDI